MRRPGAEVIATVVVCSASEPQLDAMCDRLSDDHYAPLPAATASRLCRYGRAELLILDLGLPNHSALDLLRERTRRDDFPDIGVLILMGRGDDPGVLTDDPTLAVDDYLKRPFILEELRHRLETILRRRHGRDDVVVRLGELLVDPARRKVMVGDREVHLARKEFVLLRALASDATRVFSKDELLKAVWGLRQTAGRTRTLDSHASRLRRKLDPDHRRFVVNCWGIGYRLVDSLDDAEPVVEDAGGDDR
jgi:DNA-binding response OmpR family regulator